MVGKMERMFVTAEVTDGDTPDIDDIFG